MTFQQSYPDMEFGEYLFTASKKNLDLNYAYNLLCMPSKYSTGLPPERFSFVTKNSVCFSVTHHGKQVGFSRVITDFTEFATIWDVFIDEAHRGKGLGKAMMKYLFDHPRLKGIFRW